jgi:hypothetical protein
MPLDAIVAAGEDLTIFTASHLRAITNLDLGLKSQRHSGLRYFRPAKFEDRNGLSEKLL